VLRTIARGEDPEAELEVAANLGDEDLLLYARVADEERGFGEGRRAEWRRVEYARRRAERQREKFSAATVE
jgi:hypothetical protein